MSRSVDCRIRQRIETLERWLQDQGVDVKHEQAHLDPSSNEHLYWHYGYLIGLRDALNALVKEQIPLLH